MSSSPFELFRRNLKPMMVFLTILALLSFVILPSIAMYQQQRAGSGGGGDNATLASYKGGDFTFNRVNYFTRNHYNTVQFLAQLAETTIARGGVPRVPGFQYDTERQAIQSLGINSEPSDEASVRTMMFAGEAKSKGMELDDTAIRNWLMLYSDGRLGDGEIFGVLQQSTRNQIGQIQLYDQLRNQLLAEAYQRQVMAGLASEGRPIVPPAQQWEMFLRLNRRAVADAFAVNVADFIEKTSAKPSDKQIREVFEDGRLRFPDEQSPLPAFRRPFQAGIEYLAGNLNEFIDREVALLTEEQLRAEYERRLAGGDFKLPDLPISPPATDDVTPDDVTTDDVTTDSETTGSDMPLTETPLEEPMKTEPPVGESTEPGAAEPAVPETDSVEPDAPEPSLEGPQPSEPAEDESAPSQSPQSRASGRDNASQLVLIYPQDASETPAEAAAEPAEDAPSADTSSEPDVTIDPPSREVDDQAPEVNVPPAADMAPADDAATSADAVPAADGESEARVQKFEDVRDDLARQLASDPALEKLDAAVSEVEKVMRTYFNQRAIAGGDKATKLPPRPDLKALAAELGMVHVELGPMDGREIQSNSIAMSFAVGSGFQRGDPFVQLMFVNRPPKFSPVRTVDDQSQVSYVAWKTDERDAYIPKLQDVRDEVILAIRTLEARRLARLEAEKLSKQFNATDKPIRDEVPEERSSLLFESLGPFSWMNSFGFGMRAFMGNVPELDRVGESFMRQVFTSERGVWGVAPNQPETVFYVVRPTEFSPSTDELHQRFTQASQRMQTVSLAIEEASRIRDGHYQALDKRTGFKWSETAE